MELKLNRVDANANGIFGSLLDENDDIICITLEHAYPNGDSFSAKIPDGTYDCVRGNHLLDGMTEPFETFEITGVPGHSGLLFHWGNFNKDSEGCVLVGTTIQGPMITESRIAFEKFMQLMQGVDAFQLVVSG
jgi:hypothetical protein